MANLDPASEETARLAGELLAQQQADGGWRQPARWPPTRLATGQSLYALSYVPNVDQASVGGAVLPGHASAAGRLLADAIADRRAWPESQPGPDHLRGGRLGHAGTGLKQPRPAGSRGPFRCEGQRPCPEGEQPRSEGRGALGVGVCVAAEGSAPNE